MVTYNSKNFPTFFLKKDLPNICFSKVLPPKKNNITKKSNPVELENMKGKCLQNKIPLIFFKV